MSHQPSTHEERCSNCGALNPEGQDKCVECGQPLTASADSGLRTSLEAQDDESAMGARNEYTGLGTGIPIGDPGPDPQAPGMPIVPNRPA